MVSTFTTAHPAAAKARKPTRVGMSDLVPKDKQVISHLNKIDQALFMKFCFNPASGRNGMRTERVFSLFDLQKLPSVGNPEICKLIRSLGAVAIERGYLVYQRYVQMQRRRGYATLADAIKAVSSSRIGRFFSRLQSKAQRLLTQLTQLLPGFRRLRQRYSFERILDGIVSTMPPWAVEFA